MYRSRFAKGITGLLAITFLLSGCATTHPSNQENATNTISQPQSPPYDYKSLMGFQPVLPTQNFQLKRISSYVFKYVNPPWGKVEPKVMETWGNGTAYDAMYISPDGSGKSFTVMETSIASDNLPHVGTPWTSVKHNGITLYENNVQGLGKVVATMKQGVLYVVTFANAFTTSQLEQIIESLSVPVQAAPEMIKAQTFGFKQAPTAVPFTSLIPKSIPFKWDTRTAVGEDVRNPSGRGNSDTMGRLIMTYSYGQTHLKVIEALGMKYINPNIVKAPNGVKVTLRDGNTAIYIDGGSNVSMVDGGSPNRKVLTWNLNNGVNVTIVESSDLTKDNLVAVANSLETTGK